MPNTDYERQRTFHHIIAEGSQYWNVTLLRHGCLTSTPDSISSVVSLRTIELYRRLRLRHPQLSIQAFVKVTCNLHNVRYLISVL